MKKVTIYTDGSCLGNGKESACGGWAAILTYGTHEKEIYGGEPNTTNNRMELTAVIEALKRLKEACEVEIWLDSTYVITAIGALKTGSPLVNKAGKPRANNDLIQELVAVSKQHKLDVVHVKGHSGNKYNERCDILAKASAEAVKVQVIKK